MEAFHNIKWKWTYGRLDAHIKCITRGNRTINISIKGKTSRQKIDVRSLWHMLWIKKPLWEGGPGNKNQAWLVSCLPMDHKSSSE